MPYLCKSSTTYIRHLQRVLRDYTLKMMSSKKTVKIDPKNSPGLDEWWLRENKKLLAILFVVLFAY